MSKKFVCLKCRPANLSVDSVYFNCCEYMLNCIQVNVVMMSSSVFITFDFLIGHSKLINILDLSILFITVYGSF